MKKILSIFCCYFLIVATLTLVSAPQAQAAAAPQVDNFVATNGTSLPVYSANWTVTAGAAVILGNAVTWNSATAGVAFRNDVSWANNQSATMTYGLTDSTGNSQIGPAVRCTAGNNGYLVQTSGQGPGFLRIAKITAGALATLWDSSSDGANPPPFGVLLGDQVSLTAVGTALTLLKNGIVIASITDATFASGSAGIFGVGVTQTETATAWIGDSSPTATRVATNVTTTVNSIPIGTWTKAGTITQVGDVIQFTLAGNNSYPYTGQVGGQVEIILIGGPVVGGVFLLQWSSDGGSTWASVSGVSNVVSGTTIGQLNPIYSSVFGMSGLKAATLQFGATSALTIGSPVTVWICNC